MNPSVCPLCGEANHCAMAANKAGSTVACWCKMEKFPQQLLEMVPVALKNRGCICKNCLQSFKDKTGG